MRKKEFASLIAKWETEGVVTREQADYMRFEIDAVTAEQSGNRFIAIVMYIGAIALAAGALLSIASNWSWLGREVKLLLTILLPVLPLSFAYWQLEMRRQTHVLGRAANIVGVALIGGALALIGQIYNLESNMTSFLWTWSVLSIPFVFVFRKPENLFLSVLGVGIALVYGTIDLLSTAVDDPATIILVPTWLALGYCLLVYVVASAFRHSEAWSDGLRLLRVSSGAVAGAVPFLTTFDVYARAVAGWDGGAWFIYSVLFNLLFIGYLLFALYRATRYEEQSFAFGILRLFGIYIVVKYITLFDSMFGTGMLFIGAGVLFIVGGWLLEKKKHLLFNLLRSAGTESGTSRFAPQQR